MLAKVIAFQLTLIFLVYNVVMIYLSRGTSKIHVILLIIFALVGIAELILIVREAKKRK